MTLIQMRYFYEVCKWQNITKAAERLYVSQPTVSIAMQTLESETGLNIFAREGRKIMLTGDGERLLDRVKHILDQVDSLDAAVEDMAQNRNHIRMAMPLQLGTQFLPHILGEFRRSHPEIKLEIIESGGISALHMVEDEKLDFALTNYEAGFSQHLNYEKLFTCECCLVTAKSNPLAKKAAVTFKDFEHIPLVMLDANFFVCRIIQEIFAKHDKKPNIIHSSPHLHTIKNLVRNGIASTFLTRQAIIAADNLAIIPLAAPFYINSGLVTKKGRQIYEDERLLMDYLKKITR